MKLPHNVWTQDPMNLEGENHHHSPRPLKGWGIGCTAQCLNPAPHPLRGCGLRCTSPLILGAQPIQALHPLGLGLWDQHHGAPQCSIPGSWGLGPITLWWCIFTLPNLNHPMQAQLSNREPSFMHHTWCMVHVPTLNPYN